MERTFYVQNKQHFSIYLLLGFFGFGVLHRFVTCSITNALKHLLFSLLTAGIWGYIDFFILLSKKKNFNDQLYILSQRINTEISLEQAQYEVSKLNLHYFYKPY